jgi:hypothetical protein
MVDTLPRHEPTLTEFVVDRARRASDARLALNAGLGFSVAAAVGFWRPPAWIAVVSLALAFGAYGCWAIADRELGEGLRSGWMKGALRALRAGAAVVGVLASLGFLATVLGFALGTIIS